MKKLLLLCALAMGSAQAMRISQLLALRSAHVISPARVGVRYYLAVSRRYSSSEPKREDYTNPKEFFEAYKAWAKSELNINCCWRTEKAEAEARKCEQEKKDLEWRKSGNDSRYCRNCGSTRGVNDRCFRCNPLSSYRDPGTRGV